METKGVPFLECVSTGCKEKAVWGVNWVPTYCDSHKSLAIHHLEENRCNLCKHMTIVNEDGICKKCTITTPPESNVLYNPNHPHFSISNPSVRPIISSNDVVSKTLRLIKSSPNVLLTPPSIAMRRSSALSIGSVVSVSSDDSKPNSRRPSAVGSTLKAKLTSLQTDNTLQNNILAAKKKLKDAKAAYEKYSSIDTSPSKTAANEEMQLAEKEVEDACKAWCYAQRN